MLWQTIPEHNFVWLNRFGRKTYTLKLTTKSKLWISSKIESKYGNKSVVKAQQTNMSKRWEGKHNEMVLHENSYLRCIIHCSWRSCDNSHLYSGWELMIEFPIKVIQSKSFMASHLSLVGLLSSVLDTHEVREEEIVKIETMTISSQHHR